MVRARGTFLNGLRRYRYVLVDVFTSTRLQGNPLAVFPQAADISDSEMQQIAGELNLSETIFLLPAAGAGAAARARIFTPRRELDFAGHPTIGAAYVLSSEKTLQNAFAIEERVGVVRVEQEPDEQGNPIFWLTTPKLVFFETLEPQWCARLLNVPSEDVSDDAPPQFVSAGSPMLFVCLKSTDAVDRAELQQAYLRDAIGSVNSVGTFVFARTQPGSAERFDVYSRMFAPQTGIVEDPATGSATGPLAGYMRQYGLLPERDVSFVSEQGVKMGRRSILRVRVTTDEKHPEPQIRVGGSVVPVAEGTFLLS